MKKILILSVTAGNGHNACAKGMKKKLEELAGDEVEVKIIDTLNTYSTSTEVWFADKGYTLSVSKFLPIYNMCYNYFKKLSPDRRWVGSTQKTALTCVGGILKEILAWQPDVVYCTHFYPAIALTDLRLVYDLPCKVVVSSLDYVNSPFWESAIGVDYFTVPNEDFVQESMEEGFKYEQMLPLGLPVDGRTLDKNDRKEARTKLGLENDVFTVMVMFGGGCWKGGRKIFDNVIKSLKGKQAQVIMINGKNQEDFKRIEKMTFPDNIKVVNVGFTSELPLYMSAADVIINKCGGPSVTEIVNVGRPMLITEKLPTQELYNLKYMKEKGVALSFRNKKELFKNLNLLYEDENLRLAMEDKSVWLRKNAVDDLANLLLSFDKADYSMLYNKQGLGVQILSEGVNIRYDYRDKINKEIRKKVQKAMKIAHKQSMQNKKVRKKEKEELKYKIS